MLSDEIYARIIYGGQNVSMLGYPGMEERTLIIDGFSKSFAMTGWRLGYTVAPAHIVPALQMLAVNSYTCVVEFTEYGAIEALKDRSGATPRMMGEFAKRRAQFLRDLNRVPGFRCALPEGAFYAWVSISDTGMTAEELCRITLEEAGWRRLRERLSAPPAENSFGSHSRLRPQLCRKPCNVFSASLRRGKGARWRDERSRVGVNHK